MKTDHVINKIEVLTDNHSELKEKNKILNKKVSYFEDIKVAYLERQSKRNNPVFCNIQEKKGETWDECEEAATEVIEKNLNFLIHGMNRYYRLKRLIV